MSPSCDNCGEFVSSRYYRVRKGNDGKLHGCPSCTSPAVRARAAAGLSSRYTIRSDANGEKVATDGGDSA